MVELVIEGKPLSWLAPIHSRNRCFDLRAKEKNQVRWQIRSQYKDPPVSGCVQIDFSFFFPVPKSVSSIRKKEMLAHHLLPGVKPDTTNLQKFYEDCLKEIVIADDKWVTDTRSRKRYSLYPRVVIRVISMNLKWEDRLKEIDEMERKIEST